MSKIWKKPVQIPEGIEVNIKWNLIKVKWPKWELQYEKLDCVKVEKKENFIELSISNDDDKKFWGLTRSLIANMIEWVVTPYQKKLLIIGVGYGAQLQGKKLILSLGFSHKINYTLPDIVDGAVEQDPKGNTVLTLTSIDKQKIGQVAAEIRDYRKPEPYKGKGVRYFDEIVKLKAGKAAKK